MENVEPREDFVVYTSQQANIIKMFWIDDYVICKVL